MKLSAHWRNKSCCQAVRAAEGAVILMEALVEADQVSFELSGNRVLDGVTFSAFSGEMIGIIGPNGAGKTTLLRAILGLVALTEGQITLFGRSAAGRGEIGARVGYMPQRQSCERSFPFSCADVVQTGLLSARTVLKPLRGKDAAVAGALTAVAMENFCHRPFQTLSGGEQQRVMLARALVKKPRLLLLDEPSSGLDYPAQQEFLKLLVKLCKSDGITVLLVSHDLLSVASSLDRLICINRSIHIHGKPAEVLSSSQLGDAYCCPFDQLKHRETREG